MNRNTNAHFACRLPMEGCAQRSFISVFLNAFVTMFIKISISRDDLNTAFEAIESIAGKPNACSPIHSLPHWWWLDWCHKTKTSCLWRSIGHVCVYWLRRMRFGMNGTHGRQCTAREWHETGFIAFQFQPIARRNWRTVLFKFLICLAIIDGDTFVCTQ